MHYDVSWQQDSKCLNHEPEFFFPKPGRDKKHREEVAMVKKYCNGCPVKMKCLEFAFRENLNYGVYGGMSEEERIEIKNRYIKEKLNK